MRLRKPNLVIFKSMAPGGGGGGGGGGTPTTLFLELRLKQQVYGPTKFVAIGNMWNLKYLTKLV